MTSSPAAPSALGSAPAPAACGPSVTTTPDATVLQGFQVVCICRGIRRKTIEQAIRAGARTVAEVRRRTGATTGACGATRCTGPINAMLVAAGGTPGPLPSANAGGTPRPGGSFGGKPRRY